MKNFFDMRDLDELWSRTMNPKGKGGWKTLATLKPTRKEILFGVSVLLVMAIGWALLTLS